MSDTQQAAALDRASSKHAVAASGVAGAFAAGHAADVQKSPMRFWGLLVGVAALAAIVAMPQPAGLSVAGQHMLGIFVFAVVIWMTEAVEYAASSIMLMALMAFLLGTAPDPAHPERMLGTGAGLRAALDGFTNPAVALIAASLVIAAAMAVTGLDKRVAFKVISLIGTSRSRILIGTIIVMAVLAFFIPTASARVACLTPIILGLIAAFGIDKKSRFAGMLMMAICYLSLIWAMGIATGAAQNVYVNALMERTIHVRISWIDWLIVGAPFSAALSVAMYFLLMRMMAPKADEASAQEAGAAQSGIARTPERLGPMTADEIKLLIYALALLGFWATENKLHDFDSSSGAVAAVALMFLPRIGVLKWPQVQARVPWGILIQLGVGVGLGTALLKTGAAAWLASYVVTVFDVQHLSVFAILAVLWLFLIVIHLGFASGAAMATTMIPVMISMLQQTQLPTQKIAGVTMLLSFVTSVGWILPINGPQNMLAYGTGTFEARDFIRVGIVLTVIAYLMLLVFAATYWRWLGYT
ncbi:MAG TPA: DASS family sodium-coupled anion symporter [Xanthobacteraceae bacterium]|nr:DASS family sodium-coupled anion symporter [Xanthobacteraceae bacterium]